LRPQGFFAGLRFSSNNEAGLVAVKILLRLFDFLVKIGGTSAEARPSRLPQAS
jgi:hypothetical protein